MWRSDLSDSAIVPVNLGFLVIALFVWTSLFQDLQIFNIRVVVFTSVAVSVVAIGMCFNIFLSGNIRLILEDNLLLGLAIAIFFCGLDIIFSWRQGWEYSSLAINNGAALFGCWCCVLVFKQCLISRGASSLLQLGSYSSGLLWVVGLYMCGLVLFDFDISFFHDKYGRLVLGLDNHNEAAFSFACLGMMALRVQKVAFREVLLVAVVMAAIVSTGSRAMVMSMSLGVMAVSFSIALRRFIHLPINPLIWGYVSVVAIAGALIAMDQTLCSSFEPSSFKGGRDLCLRGKMLSTAFSQQMFSLGFGETLSLPTFGEMDREAHNILGQFYLWLGVGGLGLLLFIGREIEYLTRQFWVNSDFSDLLILTLFISILVSQSFHFLVRNPILWITMVMLYSPRKCDEVKSKV